MDQRVTLWEIIWHVLHALAWLTLITAIVVTV